MITARAIARRGAVARLEEDMSDDITIRGQATLEWGDQLRFLARRLTMPLLKLAAVITPVFGTIWAVTLSDEEWLDLRVHPLASLADFVTDAWPFYLGTFALLILLTIGQSYFAFRRFPQANRRLSYEVDAKGILTKDGADFALMVPWSSIVHTRNTSRYLYMKTVPGARRHLLWRAFAPADRDQILRWATGERTSGQTPPGSSETTSATSL
jgi:hypothetical protein